jgi:hypothetical protein
MFDRTIAFDRIEIERKTAGFERAGHALMRAGMQ